VTALDAAEAAPGPLPFAATTVKVYAVPGLPPLRPAMVTLVAGGDPLTVTGVRRLDPTCGVMV
jgi:hypothetical protein